MNNELNQTITVLPLGAWEQHGPHLPLQTDAIIASEFASRLEKHAFPVKINVLPTEPIGYSVEHLDFNGSKSLSYDEAISKWLKIIKVQVQKGHRKILLLNAHGGNSPLLTIVATEARVRWNVLVVVTHWTRFGLPEHLQSTTDKSIDIHAGDIETSIMLAIAPDLVDMKKAHDYGSRQSEYIKNFKHLRAYGQHSFGWKMKDLNEHGVVGFVTRAKAEKGHQIIDHAFSGICELIEDMIAFDISELK